MRYEVPQFIDVKDKIFGPFTVMQFLYLLGGAGFGYLSYRFIPLPFNYVVAGALVIFALLLAFYKYNGRPFLVMIEAMFYYVIRKKQYLWQHRMEPQKTADNDTQNNIPDIPKPPDEDGPLPSSKLKDLAWSLDILDKT